MNLELNQITAHLSKCTVNLCVSSLFLQKIIDKVGDSNRSSIYHDDDEFRSYEFYFTCAVDKNNIKKVLEGCKNIIIREHLVRWGCTR